MTWTKLSDDFDQHPKIIAAGERAELLHVHGLIYSNRYLLDGFIPAEAVPHLSRHARFEASIEALIKLGIWVPVEGGYQIHDFLKYQRSRKQVLAERERNAKRLRLLRATPTDGNAESVSAPYPSRPVGSLEPRLGDDALLVGTGLKSPTNGADAAARLRGIAAQALPGKGDS
jgi:hypothetical protein